MPSLPRSLRRPLAFAALLLSPVAALAVSPANRIATIDTASRGTLAHAVAGRTKSATDLGQAPADHVLNGVTLFFSRTAAQQTALDQLMAAQQTPGSPLYHQWLTPSQFGQQFGLSAPDLEKVTSWLSSQGLTVSYVAPSNALVRVSGTVAQLQQAFGTSIHSLNSRGEQHVANVTNPVLPAAIANVVSGIAGLDDFLPHSHARTQAIKPAFTSGVSGLHFLSPGDFHVIYDSNPLLASAINGTGTSIALMGQATLSLPDVASFRAAGGLPAQVPTTVSATAAAPTFTGNDLEESQLDVEWAGASAPNAQIIYVTSANGVFDSLQYAINQQTVAKFPIISISYGSCEPDNSGASATSYSALFQQANVQGQTILAAAGDSGATDCEPGGSVAAADGLAVDFPGTSPFVTSVGGTMFNDTAANWTAASTSDQITSALGYIPETVWNEFSALGVLASGGGGASLYFAKPSWQVAAGVPADSSRDVPDVALNAAASHVPYLYCVPIVAGDPSATVDSCTSGFRNSLGNLTAVGGTSAAAPSFAGVIALLEQKLNATTGLGNINPVLYGQAGTAAFHDIATGNNSSPCNHGSPDCQTASSLGFSAAPGYDLASGLGSIDANIMVNAWAATPAAGGTSTTGASIAYVTVTLPAGAQTCAINTSTITTSVQVTPNAPTGAMPTGVVQLLVDGAAVGAPVTLSGGLATLVVSTAGLSSGAHSISALYTGDSVYAASKSYLGATLLPNALGPNTIVDVVSTTSPDFALGPCFPNLTVASGATSTPITLTATFLNGFSGTVAFSASSDANLAAGFNFSAPVVTAGATTTSLTLSAFATSPTSTNAVGGSGAKRIPSRGTASLSRRGLLGTGAGTAALASVLFLVLPRRRRYLGLLALILSAGAIGISGCGSGATPIAAGTVTPGTTTATAPGTYVVNITASGTNGAGQALVHTTFITLTVTQ